MIGDIYVSSNNNKMTKTKEFNMLDNEFIEKANGFAEDEPYQLIFLHRAIDMILDESKKINDAFILERDECLVIGLSIDKIYFFRFGRHYLSSILAILGRLVVSCRFIYYLFGHRMRIHYTPQLLFNKNFFFC